MCVTLGVCFKAWNFSSSSHMLQLGLTSPMAKHLIDLQFWLLIWILLLSFAKPPMHLHAPAILASSFWYPSHVGSFKVSHNRFWDPNGSYASLRWTNHSSSINIILVLPKSRECIIGEFWLRNVTIWTLITLMSLWPTSVAKTAFNLSWWGLALVFAHLLLFDLKACCRGLIVLDMHLRCHCCQNRSNWFPKPVRPVWYR
jgi:hypothetical protein